MRLRAIRGLYALRGSMQPQLIQRFMLRFTIEKDGLSLSLLRGSVKQSEPSCTAADWAFPQHHLHIGYQQKATLQPVHQPSLLDAGRTEEPKLKKYHHYHHQSLAPQDEGQEVQKAPIKLQLEQHSILRTASSSSIQSSSLTRERNEQSAAEASEKTASATENLMQSKPLKESLAIL
ncbi:hypothetical protein AAVH_13722 [Aphelenchoides avenae]|nr:hypothetical protein AAVH_13722 [Aphelenchus avenae]